MKSGRWWISGLAALVMVVGGLSVGVYADDDDKDDGQADHVKNLRGKIFDMFDQDDDGKLSEEEAKQMYAWLEKHFDALPYDDVVAIYNVVHRYHPAFVRWAEKHGWEGDWAAFYNHLEKGIEQAREKHHEAREKAGDRKEDAQEKARDKKDDAKEKAGDKKEDAKEKASDKREDAKDKAKDKREDAREKAKEKRDDAQDKAGDKRDDAQDKARDKRKEAQDKSGNARKAAQDKSSDWHKNMGDALDRDIKNRPPKAGKKGGGGRR